jgi:hypothetical protein
MLGARAVSGNGFEQMSERERAEHAACARDHRASWRVYQRRCNASAFNGYHLTRSAYSGLVCTAPGCGRRWRTKAGYVAEIPDLPAEGTS